MLLVYSWPASAPPPLLLLHCSAPALILLCSCAAQLLPWSCFCRAPAPSLLLLNAHLLPCSCPALAPALLPCTAPTYSPSPALLLLCACSNPDPALLLFLLLPYSCPVLTSVFDANNPLFFSSLAFLLVIRRTILIWYDSLPGPFGRLDPGAFCPTDLLSYFNEEVGRTVLVARQSDREEGEANKRIEPTGSLMIMSKNKKAAVLKVFVSFNAGPLLAL